MNTSVRRIASIAVAVAVALTIVWYLALWRPQAQNLSGAHNAQAAAQAQVDQLDSQVAQLQALVRRIPADTARLHALDAALPDNPSLATALTQLHQVADAAGVSLTSVGPSAPAVPGAGTVATPGGTSIDLTLSAQGSYTQLLTFVTDLDGMSRALVIDHLSLSGTTQLSVDIGARIFYAGSPTP